MILALQVAMAYLNITKLFGSGQHLHRKIDKDRPPKTFQKVKIKSHQYIRLTL